MDSKAPGTPCGYIHVATVFGEMDNSNGFKLKVVEIAINKGNKSIFLHL
jgi:hypothetical protein